MYIGNLILVNAYFLVMIPLVSSSFQCFKHNLAVHKGIRKIEQANRCPMVIEKQEYHFSIKVVTTIFITIKHILAIPDHKARSIKN